MVKRMVKRIIWGRAAMHNAARHVMTFVTFDATIGVTIGRHDGWSADKGLAFLRVLVASNNVSDAFKPVGISRQPLTDK